MSAAKAGEATIRAAVTTSAPLKQVGVGFFIVLPATM